MSKKPVQKQNLSKICQKFVNLSKICQKLVKNLSKICQKFVKNIFWFLHEDKYKSRLFSRMEFLSFAYCVQQNVNFSSIYLRLKYKQGSKVRSNFLCSEISWKANDCSGGGNKILIMSSIFVYTKVKLLLEAIFFIIIFTYLK